MTTDTVLSLVKNVLKPNVDEMSAGLDSATDNMTNNTDAISSENITSLGKPNAPSAANNTSTEQITG